MPSRQTVSLRVLSLARLQRLAVSPLTVRYVPDFGFSHYVVERPDGVALKRGRYEIVTAYLEGYRDGTAAHAATFVDAGRRGGQLGGARSLETMTADARRARALTASRAAAAARALKRR